MSEQKLETLVQACVAGTGAVAVRVSAEALFHAGGKHLLNEGSRAALKAAVSTSARGMLEAAVPAGLGTLAHEGVARLSTAAETMSVSAAGTATRALARTGGVVGRAAALAAGRSVLRGAGKAAGVGLVIDGVIGGVQAFSAFREGRMTKREAVVHTAKEAATGAVATGVAVAVAAGVVAVTGGLAAPVVFAVGAGASVGAKTLLRQLVG